MLTTPCLDTLLVPCKTTITCQPSVIYWPILLFLSGHVACGIIVPLPEIEPMPPDLGALVPQILDHQGSPRNFLNICSVKRLCPLLPQTVYTEITD